MIEIGRETRYDLYDLFLEAPPTLVPRHRRHEVRERLDFEGKVLLPSTKRRQTSRANWSRTTGVEAIAISFLHAYRNPDA